MKSLCYTTTLSVMPHQNREHEVHVWYEFHRAIKGATDGRFGPPLEPDEDAEVTINSITLSGVGENGRNIKDLFDVEDVIERIFIHLEDRE